MSALPPPADDFADLLEQINQGVGYEDLFNRLYDRLHGVVPYHRIAVALLTDDGDRLRLISCRSDGPLQLKLGYTAPLAGSTLAELLRTGQPRILNDLPAYLAGKPTSNSTRLIVREGLRANLTLPLVADGRPIGVVFFASRDAGVYRPEHAGLLRRLAGHLALSIEKARLIEALRQRNEELREANGLKERFLERLREEVARQTHALTVSEERYRLLVELGRAVNGSLDLRQVFERAAGELHRLTGCDRVSLILVDRPAGVRHGFALEYAGAPRWVEVPRQDLRDSAAEWVLQQKSARIASSLEQAHPFAEDRSLYQQGYKAYVYLPLVSRDQGVGVLGLAARTEGQLDRWDLGLLRELAAVLAPAVDSAAAYTHIARLQALVEEENRYLRDEIRTGQGPLELVGDSSAMRGVRRALAQVAPTGSTVLILGETGTGKELVARAIHAASPRRDGLLVAVNCAALAPGLLPSELFGHEAGAFTGALKSRAGRFERAHGGTLFLDEIGEVSGEVQVLLLRALQERTIERVGGHEPVPVDVRLIAATNRDLQKAMEEGAFRRDLYYRLNVFPIHVPPLRQRREDVPALLHHFAEQLGRRMHRPVRGVSPRTLELALDYAWPGNVRELENLVERALIVGGGDLLEIDPTWLSPGTRQVAAVPPASSLAQQERASILSALERCRGKVYGPDGAAALLGLRPTTLYGKMRKHGIQRKPGKWEKP
jgi:formate hydrogenlyase transcriptional activator